jgi:UDP-galactopyranose mutase
MPIIGKAFMQPSSQSTSAHKAVVVGAGVTGSTAAHLLHEQGWHVEVIEKEPTWGGQLRSATAADIPYEPHGAHILHTDDTQVWELITRHVRIQPYQHKVRTVIGGDREVSWPPQIDELRQLVEWPQIERQLEALPDVPDRDNFERWCVSIMGRTLYEMFVYGYTRKQWGREPSELDSSFAPKRIELRTDNYLGLFRSRHQGWADHIRLIDSLLAGCEVYLGYTMNAHSVADVARWADAVIVTGPLDVLFDNCFGPLDWRGVEFRHRYMPKGWPFQSVGVINRPTLEVPYTRTIETRHMTDAAGGTATVVSYEFPGAAAKHYPVNDRDGRNRALQRQYEAELSGLGPNIYPAGRLARYVYIDIDQAVRQGLNIAQRILRTCRDSS